MARSEIEQDVGGVPDQALARFQKRRGEWRRAFAAFHHPHHRRHTALAAGDVSIIGAGLLQRETDKFAAALDAWPVIEFVAHRRSFTGTCHGSAIAKLRPR